MVYEVDDLVLRGLPQDLIHHHARALNDLGLGLVRGLHPADQDPSIAFLRERSSSGI